MEVVAESSRAFVARHFGAAGRAWLATLPRTIEAARAEWDLELGDELRGGLLAHVVEARTRVGRDVVFKVGAPWDRPRDEIACLRAWAGRPSQLLVHADPHRGALLLERIRPGTVAIDARAEEVAELVAELQSHAPPGDLPPLASIVRRRLEQAVEQGRATPERAAGALRSVERLEADAPASVIVHGDFDERNLLRCEVRGLAAIDPLPCVGDGAYDLAYWAHANGRRGKRERVEAIARAAGIETARVRRWAAVIGAHG